MRFRSALVSLAGLSLAACSSDSMVNEPSSSAVLSAAGAAISADDPATVSPVLAQLDATLAASGSNLRVAKAELLIDGSQADASSLTLIANDRARGIGARWVAGDPRRGGRRGITYAFDTRNVSGPIARNVNGNPATRLIPFAEVEPLLEEGMSSWRAQQCASAPIARTALPAGVDPDLLDQLFLGADGARPYVQVADLVQGGWQPTSFFTAFAGAQGANILGVAFTFWFVDESGNPTDIDRDGNFDTGLVEIYYSNRFLWATDGGRGVDFFSVIAHETGHGMGLAHFGKVFVTRVDAADGLQVTDVKYAPKALMNASYVAGRNAITGTDRSSFCQIWGNVR